MAMMSGSVSQKSSTQAVKQVLNGAGSWAFITSIKVSWDGMPRS
ncbi:MAG: hypothetical protein OEM59_09730 [Rhodospirillales bacterium]|nr:hypothetical protein [Rhodospirillales bacterium]